MTPRDSTQAEKVAQAERIALDMLLDWWRRGSPQDLGELLALGVAAQQVELTRAECCERCKGTGGVHIEALSAVFPCAACDNGMKRT